VDEQGLLRITDELSVPRAELEFRASRSGGPGGQHVNTSSTRVELIWDVAGTPSLTEPQRERIREKLSNRINAEGQLLLAESGSRSQHQNREAVTQRFVELLAGALHIPRPRRKTKVPRGEREKRLKEKKRRSEVKRLRGPVAPD
jgi:ribosome-associated protein